MLVLVVLAVLVGVTGSLIAGGLLLTARDRADWSGSGPVTGPSTTPDGPSEGPNGEPGGGSGGDPADDEFHYVALGDSYTAAPGVPDPDGGGTCGRSTNNYPHLVARALRGVELVDRSCNGADTSHLTTSQYPGIQPQFDALTSETDLVTISIGANDFGLFDGLVLGCARLRASDATGAPCSEVTGAYSAGNVIASIGQIGERLQTTIREIEARSPDARVLLVGTPSSPQPSGPAPIDFLWRTVTSPT
jgi:lysophospholipase L1-like esterase